VPKYVSQVLSKYHPLVSRLRSINWLSQICQQLLKTTNSTLVPLDFSLPPMSNGIFDKFLLNSTTTA
jgi:hypothetical protein